MYLMKDIVRDGDPVLRQQAAKVTFPLSDEVKEATKNMMEYLIISQDEEENESTVFVLVFDWLRHKLVFHNNFLQFDS